MEQLERTLGGLWGALTGDALGVPVEFIGRAERRQDPVTNMREFGTHRQPKGTWSDDGSLLLCTVDSLARHQLDTEDMGRRFLAWYREELWTPHGKVFDAGATTTQALSRVATGVRAEMAGGDAEYSNGNGSLMRILPVALRFAGAPTKSLLDRIHRVSAITHRHPRSQMACGLYALVTRELFAGMPPDQAVATGIGAFRKFYESEPWWSAECDCFHAIIDGNLSDRRETEIESDGYVMHTLTAGLWCLLATKDYQECVLKAVNLGGDTDTTGCVAGGLAGVAYSMGDIPKAWMSALARNADIVSLFSKFVETSDMATSGK